MNVQAMIDAWGAKKYPHIPVGSRFTLSVEKADHGFCPTCSDPFAAVMVRAQPPGFVGNTKTQRKMIDVDELEDVQLHELLAEIISASTESPQ